jgi:hypothetical protein
MSERSTRLKTSAPPGQAPRAEAQGEHRRRRKAGSLNRMVQFKLDIFAPRIWIPNYVYYWFNDEGSQPAPHDAARRLRFRHRRPSSARTSTPTPPTANPRARADAGRQPEVRRPDLRLPLQEARAFWEADNEEIVRAREDMMAGRVYRAEATDEGEQRPAAPTCSTPLRATRSATRLSAVAVPSPATLK